MIRVDVRGIKEIERAVNKVSNDMDNKYLKRLTTEGRQFGQRIMPYRSGALYQSFRDEIYTNRSAIIQDTPRQARKDPRPYHLWMAGLDKYPQIQKHIKSGDPRYMERTYKHLIKESGNKFLEITKNF